MDINLREIGFSSLLAVFGTALSTALGGWDAISTALITFMVADYATGILSAIKHKRLNSDVMFWGGIRKGLTLLVITIAIQLDQMSGNSTPVFRTLALYYYTGREGVSVAENLGLLGLPMPKFIREVLAQLQERGDQSPTKPK